MSACVMCGVFDCVACVSKFDDVWCMVCVACVSKCGV